MAAEVSMPAPVCLIENTAEGELVLKQEAIEILNKITQPVVVVAIVGRYRTGKSYLINKLAGKNKGFSLGSSIQTHTKGIWMWCLPHPQKSKHTLVLLDTEGLGDVEKGNANNDTSIFSMAILLSSVFVYNSIGTIDQRTLDQLHYVTELSNHINVKSPVHKDHNAKVSDTADFMSFFPTFIWTVRDFSLELELKGKPITADDYLENALQLLKGNDSDTSKLNLPRECIRLYFPERKCFVFDRPTSTKNLKRLEELHENDLEEDFVTPTREFCQYIFQKCGTKTIEGGHSVTGKRLANLAVAYVDAIRSGTVPCIESAMAALAQTENTAAVQEALAHYERQMREQIKFPTATVKVFLDLHAECEKEAIKIFMERSFKDEDQEFQKHLGEMLKDRCEKMCTVNEQRSTDMCRDLLQKLSSTMQKNQLGGVYSKSGGYLLFVEDQKRLTEQYRQTPGKGIKAEEVLQEYIQKQESVAMSILKVNQTLSQKEKEIAEEQGKVKAAEWELKLKEEMQAAAQPKSHEEHVKQLTRKMEEDRLKMMQDNEREISQKLKAEEVLQEYFQKQESVAMSILKLDHTLLQKEKEIAEERGKVKAAEQERKLKEVMQAAAQQKLEGQPKSHEEHVKQLTQKMEEDRLKMMQDNEREISQKLKAEDVLQEYIQKQESVAMSILKVNQTLLQKEKEIAEKQAKLQAAEQERKLKEVMQAAAQQMLEAQQKSQEEHVKQLTQKMEEDRLKMMQENERVISQKLKEMVKDRCEKFCAENEQRSTDICRNLLQKLSSTMQENLSGGVYSKPGGYLLFVEDQKRVTEQYRQTPGKGIKADEVLQEYFQKQESVAVSILKLDHILSQKKEIAEEQEKLQAAEREMKLKEVMQAAAQQKLEAQQKSIEEHVKQLTQVMEKDRLKMMQDNEREISQKLKEQALLIQEEADKQQQQMQEEIKLLQKKVEESNSCVII
ncbi:guanylate-binding protein 1-like [Lissotriton helveticus]